jgi:hypothetical protein
VNVQKTISVHVWSSQFCLSSSLECEREWDYLSLSRIVSITHSLSLALSANAYEEHTKIVFLSTINQKKSLELVCPQH